MTRKRETTAHNRELDGQLDQVEHNPFVDSVAADHTERYPRPNTVNGSRPDIITEDVFGHQTLIEVEHRDDRSAHTRKQHTAFEQAAHRDPAIGFEVDYVDDNQSGSGWFDGFGGGIVYDPVSEFETTDGHDDGALFGFL